ncbi:mandelate racemase/muconate lactonizing enzyme family protein [Hyphococcus luteus]|nr:mandelate racemase/muconate lactonizing enzyme family protein [Marinicaulis flavus]
MSRLCIEADDGAAGNWIIASALQSVAEKLADAALIGQEPRSTTSLWHDMLDRAGNDLQARAAAAALDVALWDLNSTRDNEPLWKKIGGSQKPANAHLSITERASGATQSDDVFFQQAAPFGFREGKVSACLTSKSLPDRIGKLFSALDASAQPPSLYIGAQGRCAPKDAIAAISKLEQLFDITAIEAPCPTWDISGTKKVSENIKAAVFNDLSIFGREGLLSHFRRRSLDIVQLSVLKDGVTGVLELADAAFGYELPILIASSPGNIGAHFAGALPYFMSLEIRDLPSKQTAPSAVTISNGWAQPGDAPGLGINWAQPSA